jgi:hypothetical protein
VSRLGATVGLFTELEHPRDGQCIELDRDRPIFYVELRIKDVMTTAV